MYTDEERGYPGRAAVDDDHEQCEASEMVREHAGVRVQESEQSETPPDRCEMDRGDHSIPALRLRSIITRSATQTGNPTKRT